MSEQDGAGTVAKARFDGLMSAHQKALAENARLAAAVAGYGGSPDSTAQDQSDDSSTTGDSQPEFEDGAAYRFVDGEFVPYLGTTPLRHGARDQRAVNGRFGGQSEKSIEQLEADLDAVVGKPAKSGWGDITAR